MSETWKAYGDVWSRLFDHRPVLNGEICYFVKEFEEKRADKEGKLLKALENAIEVKEINLLEINETTDNHLKILDEKLQTALLYFEKIDSSFDSLRKENEEKRAKGRERRRLEWENFMDDMSFNCQRIDNAFSEKVQELRDFYTDLDHKLDLIK